MAKQNVSFQFAGKQYQGELESIYFTCSVTGKKLQGVYRRGTKHTGTVVRSYIRFRVDGTLDEMPRWKGGANGFMHLITIEEKN